MKHKLPTRRMREHPDLEQLKRQAKELLSGFTLGDAAASAEVHAHYESADTATFALHDAQLVIARSYGFDSWPKLKAYVDGITIKRLVEAVRSGDTGNVRTMLKARPELPDMTVSYGDGHRAIHYAVMHWLPDVDAARRDRARANPTFMLTRAGLPYTARIATNSGRWRNCCGNAGVW